MGYIGAVLYFVICIELFLIFYRTNHCITNSYLYSYAISSGSVFVIANISSAFSTFNRVTLFFIYFIAVVALSLTHVLLSFRNGTGSNAISPVSWGKDKLVIFVLITCFISVVLTVMRALLYPPINNDSLVYHLPRAVYYYKMGKVSNIPSTYVVMNYSGPANAILLSHWFALTNGSELGVNLIQLPAMISVGFSVSGICRLMGLRNRYSILTGGLAMSCPLVILQGASTQNDLLAASYSVGVVYFLVKTLEDKKLLDLVSLGILGGATFLTKIAAASVIIPFLIYYIFFGIYRIIKKKDSASKLVASYIISITGAISITISFWVRNFRDLSGDFLALGPSQYMNGDVHYTVMDYIGKVWIYLVYCCCAGAGKFADTVLRYARIVYNCIGAKEYGSWDYYLITEHPNHDFYPYGFIFVLALVFLVVILIKFRNSYRLFAGLELISLILGFLIMPGYGFIQSVTRYVLGNVLVCLPCIAIGLNYLADRNKVKGIINAFSVAILGGVLLAGLYNVVICNFDDTASPLKTAFDSSYEEKRDRLEPRSRSWININDEICEIIDGLNCTNIGIAEAKLSHIYSFMARFMDENYSIRSIYGNYAGSYIDEGYVPDVIVWVDEADVKDEFITYSGHKYERIYSSGGVLDNGSEASLYVLD